MHFFQKRKEKSFYKARYHSSLFSYKIKGYFHIQQITGIEEIYFADELSIWCLTQLCYVL